MPNMRNVVSASVAGLGLFVFIGTVYAADSAGRAAYNVRSLNRSGEMQNTSTQRMPTMPTLPGSATGNLSPNLPSGNGGNGGGGDDGNGGGGDIDPEPKPETDCPDGGVRNSEYTVDNCMNDVLACVNNGALPNGLNDLFSEELRNSIVNGMGLCTVQVERCISEVRRDCRNIYRSSADVWLDFNARIVQPEYYNFVLRKTGLTPNQAENTCLLLDRNTYGSSFGAVSNSGSVTAEYNISIGAYNNQNGNALIKTQPQGVNVNSSKGVDGQRGHYARWDPVTAECWIRVAAYNKDEHITNSWLFGALGDDEPAEVWKLAGDTFTCNKDLFGFSLLNDTATVAVVGIGGGTLVGGGIGAAVGHGSRLLDCSNEKHREMMTTELRSNGNFGRISQYMSSPIGANDKVITQAQCEEIVTLYDTYSQLQAELARCSTSVTSETLVYKFNAVVNVCEADADNAVCENVKTNAFESEDVDLQTIDINNIDPVTKNKLTTALNSDDVNKLLAKDSACLFKAINQARKSGTGIFCEGDGLDCKTPEQLEPDMKVLAKIYTDNMVDLIQNGEKSNMAQSIAIGAGIGAGAGGLATAITAFVERSNINCRVGDGLAQVGLGKSYSIGSLKDFYVKWNLRLPDNILPTGTATDCESWRRTCGTLTDLNQCKSAQINYKPAGAVTSTLVSSACAVAGSVCTENYPVAKSYGACE